jgi:hypothetical protein
MGKPEGLEAQFRILKGVSSRTRESGIYEKRNPGEGTKLRGSAL